MRAIVLEAEWAPREGANIAEEHATRQWAFNANLAYRKPTISLQTIEDPGDPGPGEVVVQVGACGICGSDVHMFETDEDGYLLLPYHLKAPVVTGHEFAGRVVAAGPDVTEIRQGDLVAVEEIQWCGECRECRGGFWNQCRHIEDLGFTLNGGFAEFVKVRARFCWSLASVAERYGSEELALEVGALTEPTSVAYEGMFTRAGGFKPGSAVAIFGAGPIGLASTALARAAGASDIIVVDVLQGRRELAEKLGATLTLDPLTVNVAEAVAQVTHGNGVSMVSEASGHNEKVMGPIEDVMGVGAKLVILGMDPKPASVNTIRHQVVASSIYGSVGHSGSWDFPNVIALMGAGRISMEHAITRRFPLADLVTAIEETKQRFNGKILVKPQL
jgi:threonine dehydrogenase-like Zn-dependent dehydrogenase